MWKLVFNVVGVIFKFESCKKKTHKVHKNNAPSKLSKKCFWDKKKLEKKRKIGTHMDLWKYGYILIIKKSLFIKGLRI